MRNRKAYHANCWGPLGGNAVGVTSITQLTYRTFADIEQAIRDIAAAGYDGVEIFDGNLLDYEGRFRSLAKVLRNSSVELVAVYSGANFIFDDVLGEELARIERALAQRPIWARRIWWSAAEPSVREVRVATTSSAWVRRLRRWCVSPRSMALSLTTIRISRRS